MENKDYKTIKRVRWTITRVLELLLVLAWIFPLFWMVITSLKLESEVVTREFTFLPSNPTLANYIKAFTSTYILKWLLNSLYIY